MTVNQYKAPQSEDLLEVELSHWSIKFSDKELNKLYNRTRHLRSLCLLSVLSIPVMGFYFLILISEVIESGNDDGSIYLVIAYLLGLFFLGCANSVGLYKRLNWSKITLGISCVAYLLAAPFGTIGAIVGFVLLGSSFDLWGEKSISYKEIVQEKKNRKLRRKQLKNIKVD
ncbi:MAG: hypothetical protein HRU38_18345 [Saccharospirillaceae bacterium]|nr:hypothetical protein [Pseudomonadales bacterium]NRB80598.1 hypothetical protein [Saccharospirillaceae bacterium]